MILSPPYAGTNKVCVQPMRCQYAVITDQLCDASNTQSTNNSCVPQVVDDPYPAVYIPLIWAFYFFNCELQDLVIEGAYHYFYVMFSYNLVRSNSPHSKC